MMLLFSGIQLYLLQENVQYFKEDDPMAGVILLISIAVIIMAGFIGTIIKHGIAVSGTGASTKTSVRQFSMFTMNRLANTYGLDKEQKKLLEQIFKATGISEPQRILQNPALLDKHFKQAYRTIERTASTEEEEQRKISLLFSLRNTIENAQDSGNITTTTQVAANSTVVLVVGKESYPVKVLSSGRESLSVECPRNALGNPVNINMGTKVTISFFTKSSKGFSFDTRVVNRTDTSQGTILQVAHSHKVKNMAQRKSRRKQASMICNFYLVFIEESGRGRKKTQKLILDKRKFSGTILDISIGGCAIKTSTFIAVGSRLKIEISYSDTQKLAVLGQVLRINRSGALGTTIIHIKFLKVPRKAWNTINAMVFDYAPA